MGKETVNQEAQSLPGRMNPRMNTPRHTVIKLTKLKDKYDILNAIGEKWQITYKGTPFKIPADFWRETPQVRREWHDILKVKKGKNLQSRILYPARILFRFDGETENFPDKQKLREFSTRSVSAATDHAEAWLWGAAPRPKSGAATESARLRQRRSGWQELPHAQFRGRRPRGATPYPR